MTFVHGSNIYILPHWYDLIAEFVIKLELKSYGRQFWALYSQMSTIHPITF